ncbi:sugar transferase [soil metagenome]
MYQKYIKKVFDLFLALVSLVLLLPIAIIISIISFIIFKGKIFYKQKRIGQFNKEIEIFKFRSMTDKMDYDGNLLPEAHRLNTWGYFLRKYSMDEIPQIINIIHGDISFVGPRPLLKEYLSYYSKDEIRRHSVKPGLTGLAQVMGRNSISWDKRFSYDLYYTENLSFILDVKILMKTFFQVITGKNTHFSSSLVQERIVVPLDSGLGIN